ncbi:hypothetical protein ACHAQH_008831 [Verticillium albo-atrum]
MAPEARGRGRPRGRVAGAATRDVSAPVAPGDAIAPADPRPSAAPADGSVPPPRGEAVTKPTRGPLAGRRPRNIRRDEASRDALARQEQSKENARAKEEARRQARTRGRSQRSRGDAMGRGGAMNRGGGAAASGPFSQFLESASGRSGGWGGGGGGGGGAGGSGFGSTSRGVKGEGKPGFGSSGLHDVEARINADRFAGMPPNREPDASDEATAALINADPGARWPMGILRVDRKEEKKALATTAELEAEEHAQDEDEESLWVEGEDAARSKPKPAQEDDAVWHANPKGINHIKQEGDAGVPIDFDAHGKPQTTEPMEIDSKSVSPVGDTHPERRPKKKAALDTETEMMAADMKMLLSELGPAPDGSLSHNRDGRLYLFQFPPVLPPLHVTSGPSKVKSESDDTVILDPGVGGSIDLTGNDEHRKPKINGESKVSVSEMAENLKQGGMIGKMNVRKSGKVEFDWGGCTLELGPAAGMNFLTSAVIIEEADDKAKNGEYGGDAYGMGKIMGRFVLAPRWSDEEEWVVDPEDLKADE